MSNNPFEHFRNERLRGEAFKEQKISKEEELKKIREKKYWERIKKKNNKIIDIFQKNGGIKLHDVLAQYREAVSGSNYVKIVLKGSKDGHNFEQQRSKREHLVLLLRQKLYEAVHGYKEIFFWDKKSEKSKIEIDSIKMTVVRRTEPIKGSDGENWYGIKITIDSDGLKINNNSVSSLEQVAEEILNIEEERRYDLVDEYFPPEQFY